MNLDSVRDWKRDELRAALLYVVDLERMVTGYDRRIPGSNDLGYAVGWLDEHLGDEPLSDEAGWSIRRSEMPTWELVVAALEPVWSMWEAWAPKRGRIVFTPEWQRLRESVFACVDALELWAEEIDFPVEVRTPQDKLTVGSLSSLFGLSPQLLADATLTDCLGRDIELDLEPSLRVRRVSLPPAPPTRRSDSTAWTDDGQ